MIDSILPFRTNKSKINDLNRLNLIQFFSQRYGIGRKISKIITSYCGYNNKIKYKILENKNSYILFRFKDFFHRKKEFLDHYVFDEMRNNIKKHINSNSLKGKRFKSGMPVRGQRVKTNANNSKKLKSFLEII
jgi:small subunit ribosomal protein S13